jgi:hypothetical protein
MVTMVVLAVGVVQEYLAQLQAVLVGLEIHHQHPPLKVVMVARGKMEQLLAAVEVVVLVVLVLLAHQIPAVLVVLEPRLQYQALL